MSCVCGYYAGITIINDFDLSDSIIINDIGGIVVMCENYSPIYYYWRWWWAEEKYFVCDDDQ